MSKKTIAFAGLCLISFASGFYYVAFTTSAPLTYHWRQVYGPAPATLVTPDSSTTQASNLQEGTYQFELTVTDSLGAEGKDCCLVVVNPPIVLPIILNYFKGFAEKDFNLLEWKTESEINAGHYNLESSIDNVSFQKLANIAANGRPSAYSYEDKTNNPITYYRLKMIDRDGQFKYSNVVRLKRKIVNRFIFSNVVTSELKFNFISAIKTTAKLTIYDMSGRLMANYDLNLVAGNNNFVYHTTTYAQGLYILKIQCEDFIETKKFLKK